MAKFSHKRFPKSRVATIDIGHIARRKHHVAAILEVDVTESRLKIRKYKKEIAVISFTAWLIKTICSTINENANVAGFLKGKRNLLIYHDINISVSVEKEINGEKVPIPLLIEKANEKSIESITQILTEAKNKIINKSDVVLHRKSTRTEQLYYFLPGFLRRSVWRFMQNHPEKLINKMGNVALTSIGIGGKINGWFIPFSVHPVCFGINAVVKKPVVKNDKIEIREIMNLTVLLDHDVVDGVPMARFVKELVENIENGIFL